MQIFKEMSKTILVDSGALKRLSTKDIQIQMTLMHSIKKPAIFLDSFASLKNTSTLKTDLIEGKDCNEQIEFLRGTPLSEDELGIISDASLAFKLLDTIIETIPKSNYQLQPVPNEYTPDYFTFTKTTIKRKGTPYSIGHNTLKSIWETASVYWNTAIEGYYDQITKPNNTSIIIAGFTRTVTFGNNNILIGCQTVKRWEIEQVALKLGWNFPN